MAAGRRFRAPARSIGPLPPEAAARCVGAAADLALVLDGDGVVRDSCFRSGALEAVLGDAAAWHGRSLSEMLTAESRAKVPALLRAAAEEAPQPRHVNHVSPAGPDVAIEYAAVQTEAGGPIIAFGRDLRPLSALQQRLLDAQQAMARDYTLQRQAEARWRVLFELSPDPLLLLDAASLRVQEANPAARHLSGEGRRASGWPVAELFAPPDRAAVLALLSAVRAGTASEPLAARLLAASPGELPARLAATLLVEEPGSVVLLHLLRPGAVPDPAATELRERLLGVVERAPDGYVFTDAQGEVLAANAAFLSMVQLPAEDAARGRPLESWLGQPGVDVEVLLANLRTRGAVQLFATTLRGEHAQTREVEVSAAAMDGPEPSFGFAIRDVGRRIAAAPAAGPPLPRSVEQLTELIGRVPLKDLVRDATDVIERLCIEAALELTGDNRASAAEMLGLSRQSLYVRLRRFGMGDHDEGGEAS